MAIQWPKNKNLTGYPPDFLARIGTCCMPAYILLFSAIAVASFTRSIFFGVGQTVVYGYFFFRLMRLTRNFQQVSFDEDFLYVFGRDQDLIIPLENIESVEITSLGGVYKVNLYHAEQLGNEFYFKTSLLYPLNYKSKDALVNQLRAAVAQARRKPPDNPGNVLTS
jgi:hypothetical protein